MLMFPLAFGAARWSPPSVEVQRGLSSIELELIDGEGASQALPGQPAQGEGEEAARADVLPALPSPTRRSTAGAPARSQAAPGSWLNDGGAWTAQPVEGARNRAPAYPRVARIQGWEGKVLVRAWVTPSGGVASVRVTRSSGREVLDRAALYAVNHWKFRPARRKGQAVASEVEVPIAFRLKTED
ncbi:MAG: energy transducer TonB [Candidatus Omnitrophica bacterium]|nr:energy transducer TonB [Candidatus Omnitrophota bacterium]